VITYDLRELQDQALMQGMRDATGAYSIERLLTDPELQTQFHRACEQQGLLGDPAIWNHRLLDLRKEGKLPRQAGNSTTKITATEVDTYLFAAEIAWVLTCKKFGDLSLAELFSSPDSGQFFDRAAARFAPGHSAADYRRGAFLFRRIRKPLSTEAKEFHYVLRTREFTPPRNLSLQAAKAIAGQGGVYQLLGAKNATLYIGEAVDLGKRLEIHAAAAATRTVVKKFAVILESELPSAKYRPLLKVDLAQRIHPAWNRLD
jgi:hypothetical protein